MKRILAVSLAMLCLTAWVAPSVTQAVSIVADGGMIVFADDFSSGTVPAATPYSWEQQTANTTLISDSDPDVKNGWICKESPGERSKDVQVTSAGSSGDDPGPYTGANYLRLHRPGSGVDAAAMAQFGYVDTDAMHIEFMMYVDSTVDSGAMVNLSTSILGQGSTDARIQLLTDHISGSLGIVNYYDGGWSSTGVAYTSGQWQKWQIDHNITGNTFVLTIGGVSSEALPAVRPGPAEVLAFRAGVDGGKFYVDAAPPQQCGDAFVPYDLGDISGPNEVPDCVVNVLDLGVLLQDWLSDTAPQAENRN